MTVLSVGRMTPHSHFFASLSLSLTHCLSVCVCASFFSSMNSLLKHTYTLTPFHKLKVVKLSWESSETVASAHEESHHSGQVLTLLLWTQNLSCCRQGQNVTVRIPVFPSTFSPVLHHCPYPPRLERNCLNTLPNAAHMPNPIHQAGK